MPTSQQRQAGRAPTYETLRSRQGFTEVQTKVEVDRIRTCRCAGCAPAGTQLPACLLSLQVTAPPGQAEAEVQAAKDVGNMKAGKKAKRKSKGAAQLGEGKSKKKKAA
jgi:hypothetical protein